jgi:hypothetical protein
VIDAIVVVILGIFVGAAIMTVTPWYLKLRAIQQKAEEQGVDPVLPKFGMFYAVTGGLSVVIAGVMNLGLAQQVIDASPNATPVALFITALLSAAGSNAILNLTTKTGGSDIVFSQKKNKDKVVTAPDEPPILGDTK